MLPTMTMTNVAPPARGTASVQPQGAADGDDTDAFANALQHARRQPQAAHESRATAGKPATEARPARPTANEGEAHEGVPQRPAGDVPARGDEPVAAREAGDGDGLQGAASAGVDATAAAGLPIAAPDVIAVPRAAIDASHCAPAPDGEADALPALDGAAMPAHAPARSAGQDARTVSLPASRTAAALDGAGERNLTAAAARLLQAAPERAAPEGTGAAANATRAPSFDGKPAAEPMTLPAALAAAASRDWSSQAVATGPESHAPHATLHASIDERGFGTALGHQVALWVRDGVQEARLQLHPAELGPVTVQIALDGQTAHVDFVAAVAATRDSIEQSLPALAAALRESGFTLTGGGVSGQAAQGGDHHNARREAGPPQTGDRSRFEPGVDAAPTAATPRRWNRSLLDVYA